jgi:hypothetical protein
MAFRGCIGRLRSRHEPRNSFIWAAAGGNFYLLAEGRREIQQASQTCFQRRRLTGFEPAIFNRYEKRNR